MMNELATTTSLLVKFSTTDIENAEHADKCWSQLDSIEQATEHARRVLVTYYTDHCDLSVIEIARRTGASQVTVRRWLTRARQLGMAKEGRKSVNVLARSFEPETLSAALPSQRDFDNFKAAPLAVKQQVVDIANIPESFNDKTVEKVRELINPNNYSIDTTSLTDEEKDECLIEQNTRIEALTANAAFNDQACAVAMQEYGYINSDGFWQDKKPLTIIKNLLPELSQSERQQLIDLLISPIQQ